VTDHDDLSEIAGRAVSRETIARLELIAARVREEAQRQNLVSAATIDDLWQRHIVDSVQLLRYADGTPWLDLGTGAGFPGLVIAAFDLGPVILCEERRLRHEFLSAIVAELALAHVTVAGSRLEMLPTQPVATISARAFAPLDKIFRLGHRFSTENTRWILPKGRSAREDLASARAAWQCDARLEPSVTNPESAIVIADHVRMKTAR
jgi:16S rRNA (guanine527-N7)-methyltransferase